MRQLPWQGGVAVPLPTDTGFEPHEHWAWARIIRGETADMRFFPIRDEAAQTTGANGPDDGGGVDPKAAEKWPAHRSLSSRFMRTILFCEPWASAPARPWVRVECAAFFDQLDWNAEHLAGDISLANCLFKADVDWRGLRVEKEMRLSGSRFEGAVSAYDLAIGAGLFFDLGFSAKGDINLQVARVGESLSFSGATLEGALWADGLTVERRLACNDGFCAKGDISLVDAHVGGQVQLEGATLEGALVADGLGVEGSCFLREMKKLGNAALHRSNIRGHLQLSGSAIDGRIDLTGAVIGGELSLAQFPGDEPRWGENARLVLRNAKAGALAGGLHAFRRGHKGGFVSCDLAGFLYDRLGGIGAGKAGSTLASTSGNDLRAWLKCCRPQDHYDPAPYHTLAKALRDSGRRDRAADVRMAQGNYELVARGTPLQQRFMLLMSSVFIGYGERNHRALVWFALLVIAAAAVGYWQELDWLPAFAPAGWTDLQAWRDWIGYAFGGAVPLLTFDEGHKTFLVDRFCGERVDDVCTHGVPTGLTAFFYAVKVLGFIILSYLAAGLSGLAQRRD